MAQSQTLNLEELSTNSIDTLRRALEGAKIMSAPEEGLHRPSSVAYVLEGLKQHRKAKRLVLTAPNGAASIDLHQFTVKEELRPLARHIKAPQSEGKKAAIIASIIQKLQGEITSQTSQHVVDGQAGKAAAPALPPTDDRMIRARTQSSGMAAASKPSTTQVMTSVREVASARHQSSDYSTAAGPTAHAVAAQERQPQGLSSDTDLRVRHGIEHTLTPPLPHRNRDHLTSFMRKLFGRGWQREVVPEAHLQPQQGAVITLAAPGAKSKRPEAGIEQQRACLDSGAKCKMSEAGVEQQRASLEQQWAQREQSSVDLQADPWSSLEVMALVRDVQRLHCKGKGQSAPGTATCIQRLRLFAERMQGFEAYMTQPSEVIARGSKLFGTRNGFVVLLRGPEQYLTKGRGHMYVYYSGDMPNEYKVGVCEDLPVRRLETGKLVGRVVNQGNRNHKEYVLKESFEVLHRTLVDQVLKIRLKQWNFPQAIKGDGYTEWFKNISFADLRDHILDVKKIVTAMYPES